VDGLRTVRAQHPGQNSRTEQRQGQRQRETDTEKEDGQNSTETETQTGCLGPWVYDDNDDRDDHDHHPIKLVVGAGSPWSFTIYDL
jgi:hypothetical protein